MARTANRVAAPIADMDTAALTSVASDIRHTDWVLVGLWAAVIALAVLGMGSLFFGIVPFWLLAMATAFIAWGFSDVRVFLSGWRAPRALALAWLRVAAVWCTAALLIVGVAVPQAWMLGVRGILIFLLLRVVCGNSGSKVVRDYEERLLEHDAE